MENATFLITNTVQNTLNNH